MKISVETIRHWPEGRSLLAVTAYDFTMARLLDQAAVDIIHVGDSLGMVMLGYPDTVDVSLSDMIRATESVARAQPSALITADLSAGTYDDPESALESACALIRAGADAVKMEGGEEIASQIERVIREGIAVQGHLGMLPQQIRREGAYKKKGKTEREQAKLLKDAQVLEALGIFSLVLEAVEERTAASLTQELSCPTIGIASGPDTTGQIHVVTDVLGLTPWFHFPHVHPQMDGANAVVQAVQRCRHQGSRPTAS